MIIAIAATALSPPAAVTPTVAEAGCEATTWTGIVAPVGVPRFIITILNTAINQSVASQSLKDKFAQIGSESAGGTPEQFGELIRKENEKWAGVVKRAGAKID